MNDTTELADLVRTAAAGDPRAWERLVTRFSPFIRSIARRHRLPPADQDDVLQRTWLALLKHIGNLTTPETVGRWLATTARNECYATLRSRRRESPLDELAGLDEMPASTDHADCLEREAWLAERQAAFRTAVERIDGRERAVLELLIAPAPTSYAEISARLGIPVGSIGPTRARMLARLRRDPHIASLFDDSFRPSRPTRPPRPDAPDII